MPTITIGTGGKEADTVYASKEGENYEIVSNWLEVGGRGVDTCFFNQNQAEVAQAIHPRRARRAAHVMRSTRLGRQQLFVSAQVPDCESTEEKVGTILKDLQTPYVDLLLIHFSPDKGDCDNAWKVLEDHVSNGTVKALGISDLDEKLIELVMGSVNVKPVVHQVKLNVFEYDTAQIEASKKHNLTVQAYSTLGHDSDKIAKNPVLQKISKAHNVSTAQVALRWILQQGYHVVLESKSKDHQVGYTDIFDLKLSSDDMKEIDGLRNASTLVRETVV